MNPPPNQSPASGEHLPRRSAGRRDGPRTAAGRHRAPARYGTSSAGARTRYPIWLVTALGIGVVLLLAWISVDGTRQRRDSDAPVGATSPTPGPDQSDLLTADSTPVVTVPRVTTGVFAPTPVAAASPGTVPRPRSTPGRTSAPPNSHPATPQPVLLGPAGDGELLAMVEGYCDRYAEGSTAQARGDGRWECQRPDAQPTRIVNMTTACRDTYGTGAYAQNPGGDPYGWRCYRSA